MKKQKPDLSSLPLWIRKVNSRWFYNSRNGAWIKACNIQDHLPKEEVTIEVKPTAEYWWQNM